MKQSKYFLSLTLVYCLMLSHCKSPRSEESNPEVLYASDAFSLYTDRVIQGENKAEVVSSQHLKSNYKSPVAETYSRLIEFKISINQKDNELPSGQNHFLVIGEEKQSPLITFGEAEAEKPEDPGTFLAPNYSYTFRIDMSPVLEAFEEKGYYEAFDGSRIAKSDFKGFYLAGGSEPMTWDFVNLENQGLKLEASEEENIYQITLILNPYNPEDFKAKEWKAKLDVSAKPQYQSEQVLVDALYNLSLEEAILAIEKDSTFRTGAKWGGVWTRDISYSIFLAFAYHEPEVARISLMKKVKRDRIIQDTGSGGAWPVSSDRTTWVLAAWELYKCTGDKDWLLKAYTIIKNTLEDDYRVLSSSEGGMYRGESSFLDWREQSYPKWMSNKDIYLSKSLGTNVVHYQSHLILSKMAKILGEESKVYAERAQGLKEAINQELWLQEAGYYAQFTYGRDFMNVSPRFEALGEALAIIFGVADEDQAQSIVAKSPLTAYGTTCLYPQIPGIPPYHNNGIWPFVQAYWNLAAAKTGNEAALKHGLASIYRAGALFLTNYENFVADNGDFLGTEINSHRMLWSMAGNLAMVHRVFIGMQFEEDGIRFQPVIPKAYGGKRTLSNFKYREAQLDIEVEGHGTEIQEFSLDGEISKEAFFPASLKGSHTLKIVMANNAFPQNEINLVENHFSLPTPQLGLKNHSLQWEPIEGAKEYRVYRNGKIIAQVKKTQYPIEQKAWGEFKVSAMDDQGYESFSSEPLIYSPDFEARTLEMESFTGPAKQPYINFTGEGFIEISNAKNRQLEGLIKVTEAGRYRLDFRYSNGSGPWNTDNKCAIRSLWLNEDYVGALVFPQRGKDEWSDWGYSNAYFVDLKAGENIFRLSLEDWNTNMNVEVNRAMLDHLRLWKVD